MSRPNDLGGLDRFSPMSGTDVEAQFHGDWEARVFGLHRVLVGKGVYTLDEHRDAIERFHTGDHLARRYYLCWMEATIFLLDERGLIDANVLVGE